jgi:hypothetical protein
MLATRSVTVRQRQRHVSKLSFAMVKLLLSTMSLLFWHGHSFVLRCTTPSVSRRSLNMMVDSDWMMNGGLLDSGSSILDSVVASSSNLLSFSDQGQNLAGILFQVSLLPYLFFLYFLSFRGNRVSDLGNFGFQFVLLFVLSTIPSGIISKSVYGYSLANTDWLHGGAESLLTIANVLIVSKNKKRYCMVLECLSQFSPSLTPVSCFVCSGFGFQASHDKCKPTVHESRTKYCTGCSGVHGYRTVTWF